MCSQQDSSLISASRTSQPWRLICVTVIIALVQLAQNERREEEAMESTESTDTAGTPASLGSEAVSQGAASVRWGGIALFIVLAFAISWAIWLGLGALGVGFTIRTAIGMFGPAAAAALVRGPLRREGFADAGLRLAAPGRNAVGMYIAAYLVPPLLLVAGIALSLVIGYQHWTD